MDRVDRYKGTGSGFDRSRITGRTVESPNIIEPLVSIIVPCYNIANNILPFVQDVTGIMEAKENFKYEIIIVDAGSNDESRDVIQKTEEIGKYHFRGI